MRLEATKDCMTCDYCRSIYFPEKDDDGVRVFAEASDQSCPVCAIKLMHASLANVRILYCQQCHGMLIPMGAFMALVEELRAGEKGELIPQPPDPSELQRKLECPQCHQRMDTHFYAGPGNVVIDDCSQCLVNWLDHGELTRIVYAPDHVYDGTEGVV
jgi:Zn-finger nucleic acid-binding protein